MGFEGFEAMDYIVGSEFGEESSSESEWSEEEMSSSSEEGLVVYEDEDFGLPEMVIFLHEPIYRVCEEVVRDEKVPPLRCLTKCLTASSFEFSERATGISERQCGRESVEQSQSGSDRFMSDGCVDDETIRFGSGIVSFDERSSVYKKVILVRDIEEVVPRSPGKTSNQVRKGQEANKELLEPEVVQCAIKDSFSFYESHKKGLKDGNGSPGGEVKKLQSLKELLSMTNQDDCANNSALSPPPMAYSMQKFDINTDLDQPCSDMDRQSFSFPILAKEWFGSPVRMAENTNKFSSHGLLRYFCCCTV